MYKNILIAALISSTALTLGGCASSLKGDVYSREDARTPQVVRMGTIESLRPVQLEGTKTPIGAGAGAVVGGIAGSVGITNHIQPLATPALAIARRIEQARDQRLVRGRRMILLERNNILIRWRQACQVVRQSTNECARIRGGGQRAPLA